MGAEMGTRQGDKKSAHTPGPWKWEGSSLEPIIKEPYSQFVHTILELENDGSGYLAGRDTDPDHSKTHREIEANKALIAASPLLYNALAIAEQFMSGFQDDELQDDINISLAIIRDALAAASPSPEEATS